MAKFNRVIMLKCVHLYSACYGVLRFIMESGAKGCEVIVSGKLRGQRAKSMKFVDGFMIHSGYPTREYIDSAVTHVHLRQGTLSAEYIGTASVGVIQNTTITQTVLASSAWAITILVVNTLSPLTHRCAWYKGEDHAPS